MSFGLIRILSWNTVNALPFLPASKPAGAAKKTAMSAAIPATMAVTTPAMISLVLSTKFDWVEAETADEEELESLDAPAVLPTESPRLEGWIT